MILVLFFSTELKRLCGLELLGPIIDFIGLALNLTANLAFELSASE
jgi:hypothetical protein